MPEKMVRLNITFTQLIKDSFIRFCKKKLYTLRRLIYRLMHMKNQESHVIPKGWLVNENKCLKKWRNCM